MARTHDNGGRGPRFLLDGEVVEAAGVPATMTLLQYLRGPLRRCGTKEGCAEGDCGACTVAIGELHGDAVRYRAVNACIRFVGTLDGKEVVTVESLRSPEGALHPVQQALVDCHGSQCGFCTPGFVMSLFSLWLGQERVTRAEAVDALSGNLCRCTGYRPILDAAERMHSLPPTGHWDREAVHSTSRRQALARLREDDAPLRFAGFEAPRTVDALAQACASSPESLLLAGGTDVGLWVTKQLRDLPPLIFLGDVAGLDGIAEVDGAIEIGAAASLTDAYAALVSRWPALSEMAARFGSVPVRNSGTLCGNLANGSPIGDSMPALIALGATVLLRRGARERVLPLEALYKGYRVSALEPGEFMRAVRVPLPDDRIVATYKVSKRIEQDISAVCGGFAVRVVEGRVADARLAYGGMAATPRRAAHAEAALVGSRWSLEAIAAAQSALARDFEPLSDFRATAAYRLQVAQALLRRFFLESGGGDRGAALRLEAVQPA